VTLLCSYVLFRQSLHTSFGLFQSSDPWDMKEKVFANFLRSLVELEKPVKGSIPSVSTV
jgi:hypothetical protein